MQDSISCILFGGNARVPRPDGGRTRQVAGRLEALALELTTARRGIEDDDEAPEVWF